MARPGAHLPGADSVGHYRHRGWKIGLARGCLVAEPALSPSMAVWHVTGLHGSEVRFAMRLARRTSCHTISRDKVTTDSEPQASADVAAAASTPRQAEVTAAAQGVLARALHNEERAEAVVLFASRPHSEENVERRAALAKTWQESWIPIGSRSLQHTSKSTSHGRLFRGPARTPVWNSSFDHLRDWPSAVCSVRSRRQPPHALQSCACRLVVHGLY